MVLGQVVLHIGKMHIVYPLYRNTEKISKYVEKGMCQKINHNRTQSKYKTRKCQQN